MFDILTDSVHDIALEQYTDAYGGRKVVDFYETPANILLDRVAPEHADGHITLVPESEDNMVELSEIPGYMRVHQQGLARGSGTRNVFELAKNAPRVGGVFGSALVAYGQVMAIMRVTKQDSKSFEVYFRQEWGIDPDEDLEPYIPTVQDSGLASLAGILENRQPEIFVHPNTPGLSRFVWHGVKRDHLMKRAKKDVTCDFAKGATYAAWQLRMLAGESSYAGPADVRLDYRINSNELPAMPTLTMPTEIRHTRQGTASALELVRTALRMARAFKITRTETAKVACEIGDVLTFELDEFSMYGLGIPNAPTIKPKAMLVATDLKNMLRSTADQGPLAFGPPVDLQVQRRDPPVDLKYFRLNLDELHLVLELVLPRTMHVAPSDIRQFDGNAFLERRYLRGLLGGQVCRQLTNLGTILFRSPERGKRFMVECLKCLGYDKNHFNHKKGDDVLMSGLASEKIRRNWLLACIKANKLIMEQHAKRSCTHARFFRYWALYKDYVPAVNAYLKSQRNFFEQYYRNRSKAVKVRKLKILFQLVATCYDSIKVSVAIDGSAVGILDEGTLKGHLVTTTNNYIRKRAKKSEVKELKEFRALAYESVGTLTSRIDSTVHMPVTMSEVCMKLQEAANELAKDFDDAISAARNGFLGRVTADKEDVKEIKVPDPPSVPVDDPFLATESESDADLEEEPNVQVPFEGKQEVVNPPAPVVAMDDFFANYGGVEDTVEVGKVLVSQYLADMEDEHRGILKNARYKTYLRMQYGVSMTGGQRLEALTDYITGVWVGKMGQLEAEECGKNTDLETDDDG